VKAFCRIGEQVELLYPLRPRLVDPDDEFLIETAFHGNAQPIITFNMRHLRTAGNSLGIETISPREAVVRMKKL